MSALAAPHEVIEFWIAGAGEDAAAAKQQNKLWFGKSDETDVLIKDRFGSLLETLSTHAEFADEFVDQGPDERLAAIIVLDQFSRNMFRGTARAFAQDAMALRFCREGLAEEVDLDMSEAERIFFYLPLEHSEAPENQLRSIEVFTKLVEDARPAFKPLAEDTLKYAQAHKAVIDQFGRYPHRNTAVGRVSTPEELEWLAKGGGF